MVDTEIARYETGEALPHVTEGKAKGLNDFKKSFGGKLYPFYRGRSIRYTKTRAMVGVGRSLRQLWAQFVE